MKTLRPLVFTLVACLAFASCDKENDGPKSYTITVTDDGNGTATASAETAEAGTEIKLTAEAANGFLFGQWMVESGDATLDDATANPATFTMPADNVAIKAIFSEIPSYSITVTAGDNGTATTDVERAVEGATVTLTATPETDFEFVTWTLTGIELEAEELEKNPLTFEMPANTITASATFKAKINVLDQITDAGFKAYAEYRMKNPEVVEIDGTAKTMPLWDQDANGKLSVAEAAQVTAMDLGTYYSDHSSDIEHLDGIEYFTGLTHLYCTEVYSLTKLNLSGNPALVELRAQNTYISSLVLNNNPAVETINCESCWELQTIDVSGCPKLASFTATSDYLETIDLSKNTALKRLHFIAGVLTNIDLSKNTELTYLNLGNNDLTSIDVSKLNKLTRLDVGRCALTSLDISALKSLTYLYCRDNKLTAMDITTMAFEADNTYTAIVGSQKNKQVIELRMRADQKAHWDAAMLTGTNGRFNTNVNVTVVE